MPIVVYFTCDTAFTTVPRSIPAVADTPTRIHAALDALVAGPTAAEQAAGFSSFFAADTAGIINAVTVPDPTSAVVDVSAAVRRIPNASTSNGARIIVGQLSRTVFQFPEIDTVTLQMDGSCAAFWHWLESSCQPITRPHGTAHPESESSAQRDVLTATPAAGVSATPAAEPRATPAAARSSAPLPAGWRTIVWEMLTVPIPPEHAWQPGVTPGAEVYQVPVLAAGRIVYTPNRAPVHPVEQPDGVGLYVLAIRGSLDDWLAHAASVASARNPLDRTTVTETTVAGQPAVRYQYVVTGVSSSQYAALKLDDDQLLLIETSNVDNADYQDVINGLQRATP